jgi:hypothetical protein
MLQVDIDVKGKRQILTAFYIISFPRIHSTFSIIHGPRYDVWTLNADSREDREVFVKGLNALINLGNETEARKYQERHLYVLKARRSWFLLFL